MSSTQFHVIGTFGLKSQKTTILMANCKTFFLLYYSPASFCLPQFSNLGHMFDEANCLSQWAVKIRMKCLCIFPYPLLIPATIIGIRCNRYEYHCSIYHIMYPLSPSTFLMAALTASLPEPLSIRSATPSLTSLADMSPCSQSGMGSQRVLGVKPAPGTG